MSPEREAQLLKIEEEARGLAAWCREFVHVVDDSSNHSIKSDFFEFLGDLEGALKPLPSQKITKAPKCKVCTYANSPTCNICGWTL